MIDNKKLSYSVILVLEDGKNLDITNAVDDLGWEENTGELATRIYFTMMNAKYNGKKISSLAKLGSLIAVTADWGNGKQEVARGTIVEWKTSLSNSREELGITCYDDLYNLQKSQDNIYYSTGIGTKSVINKILNDWGIYLEKYDGPNETHAKLVYKSETLADVLLDILDDATMKGASKYIFRSSKGKVSVLPKGSNQVIYHFGEDNTVVSKQTQSTANMITRVKVIGQEDDDGKSSVEAVLNGNTQFGIRQKLLTRSQDDSIGEAKKTAREVLQESGGVEKTLSVEGPDVPTIRRGDVVHVTAGTLNGYYYVQGVRHMATKFTISMDLEPTKEQKVAVTEDKNTKEFAKGDSVILNGAVYIDSYGNGKGMTFKNYKGKITIKVSTSRACPYHVDHIGWVYPNTITHA